MFEQSCVFGQGGEEGSRSRERVTEVAREHRFRGAFDSSDITPPAHLSNKAAAPAQGSRYAASDGETIEHPMQACIREHSIKLSVEAHGCRVLKRKFKFGIVLTCLADHLGRSVKA